MSKSRVFSPAHKVLILKKHLVEPVPMPWTVEQVREGAQETLELKSDVTQ